jgi:pimeloyl-ACP methyl ester carboxylesterase
LVRSKFSLPGTRTGLIQQARLVAKNVEGVIVRNSGHWLMEEAPDQVVPKLIEFLSH